MAIKRLDTSNTESLQLKFDNGDLKVLGLILTKWNFKDEESLLRFALAILLKAENRSVNIRDTSGSDVTLKPTDDLLKKS